MKNKKIFIGIIIIIIIISVIIAITLKNDNKTNGKENYESVSVGKNITNDYAEITFDKTVVTNEAVSKETGITLEKIDDKLYFIIMGTITNKNTVSFNFNSNFATKLLFDDKYEYSVTIAPNNLSNIDPLEKKEFIIYAAVPKNVMEVCKTYSFKFGYNDDFSNSTLEKASNKYELSGNVDQYGSADNVINFQTFSEYISDSAGQYEGLKGYSNEKSTYVIVKDGNALQLKKLEDGKSDFSIQPTFRFSYMDIMGKKCTPALIINFCTVDNPENVYYIYGNTMEISSNNGTVKIEENSTNRILIDTYKSIHHLETDFVFSSLDYDLSEIENIINGENLKIKVMVGKSGSDDVEVLFDCNEKVKNSLKQLFELNSKIVKEY